MASTNTPVKAVGKEATQRAAATGKGVMAHVVQAATPYTPPWFAAYALPPAFGEVTYQMFGHAPLSAGLACSALAMGGTALSALTWAASKSGNKVADLRRLHATATCAAATGWVTVATATGPTATLTMDSWVLGGAFFAVSWNIRRLLRNMATDAGDNEQTEKHGWGKLAEAVGLEKFQLKRVQGNGKGIVKGELAIPAGHTVEDAQAAAGKLAAALKIPPSGVIVARDSDDAGHAYLSARVADVLKDGVPYVPPAELGLLPTAPILCGRYADNEDVVINPFAATILQHLLVMGVTGAGKSEFARTVLSYLMTRRQLSIWLVDLSKGRQTVGHIADGLDWLVTQKTEAKQLLKCLPAVIRARGDELATEGLDQWSPESALNAMVVWIEEAADLADFDELDQIARAARSVGIWLVLSMQRATWTNVSTDVRSNLQAAACFGVNDAQDAGFCLPDSVVDSGAVPDWGADRPGYAYATGMGIPAGRWTQEWRGFFTQRDELAQLVYAAAKYRDPLDETTAAAAGLPYAQRKHRGSNKAVFGATDHAAARILAQAINAGQDAEEPGSAYDQDAEDAEGLNENMEIHNAYQDVMGHIPADPEPSAEYAAVQMEDDAPEPDPDTDIEFEQAAKPSTEEARLILCEQLDAWVHSNQLSFAPADLIPATVQAGRRRPWMQGELKRLVEAGVLVRDGHGDYTILQSPLIGAA